jgi:hypothetical protein
MAKYVLETKLLRNFFILCGSPRQVYDPGIKLLLAEQVKIE